jgi:hypothetical protein
MLLAEKYSSDVWTIFSEQIDKEAELASSRDMYSAICVRTRRFKEAGYQAETAEKISEYKIKYKRKPAFVDELNKIIEV